MNLTDVLREENLSIGMYEPSKEQLIDSMIKLAARSNCFDITSVKNAIQIRESRKVSGIGKGIAIPHAICRDCNCTAVAISILKHPVNWPSKDGAPVHILCIVIGGRRFAWDYIDCFYRSIRVLSKERVRSRLIKSKTIQEMHELISWEDELYKRTHG